MTGSSRKDNREILENIDPGGTIINILNEAKGDYDSLANRLEDMQNKKLPVPSSIRQITDGEYPVPSNFDEVISKIDDKLFNITLSQIHMSMVWGKIVLLQLEIARQILGVGVL